MLNYKFILSVSIMLASSAPVMAFDNLLQKQHNQPTAIYINNDAIDEKAKIFVSEIANKGMGIIKDNSTSEEVRQESFRDLLHDNFDMKTIARFALGRYWRSTSKSDQKEYLKLFEDMIVKVYSRRFSNYDGQEIRVISARLAGKSDAIVSSVIVPDNSPEIDVAWRIRQKKDGQLKIIDIMVEGVSMSLTQRADFASVIQRGGGKTEVLLAHLRPKD